MTKLSHLFHSADHQILQSLLLSTAKTAAAWQKRSENPHKEWRPACRKLQLTKKTQPCTCRFSKHFRFSMKSEESDDAQPHQLLMQNKFGKLPASEENSPKKWRSCASGPDLWAKMRVRIKSSGLGHKEIKFATDRNFSKTQWYDHRAPSQEFWPNVHVYLFCKGQHLPRVEIFSHEVEQTKWRRLGRQVLRDRLNWHCVSIQDFQVWGLLTPSNRVLHPKKFLSLPGWAGVFSWAVSVCAWLLYGWFSTKGRVIHLGSQVWSCQKFPCQRRMQTRFRLNWESE